MMQETLVNCPFCHKLSVRVLHIPFVANTRKSTCRAGGRTTSYQKERFDVLSGCEECGKTKEEVEKSLNEGDKQLSHEERIRRIRDSGLPTRIES